MTRTVQILLVEDNPADADLTRESLETSRYQISLSVAVNGSEAVDRVLKRGPFADSSTPDLILLDLNLPGLDGKAVLAEIKRNGALKRIPVTILSSSTSERDITDSYMLGANCYVVKPIDFKSFQAMVRSLETFWFGTVKLPDGEGPQAASTKH